MPEMGDAIFHGPGLATRYRVEGEGPPLVLVHGVGSRLEAWDGVAGRLGPGFRVLRYDLRGHGASGKPPGPYHLDHFVADLAALLDHLDIDRCHLAGFSLGGLIAQGFALAHAARLDKLALLSTVAGRTDEEKARVRARLETVGSGVSGAHFRKSLDRWFTPAFQEAHPEVIERLAEQNRQNDPAAYAAAYRVLAESDLAERLHEIEVPTLVMTGEGDIGSNPRMARLMAARIPGAELRILPGLRHSILTEAPDVVAEALGAFFG